MTWVKETVRHTVTSEPTTDATMTPKAPTNTRPTRRPSYSNLGRSSSNNSNNKNNKDNNNNNNCTRNSSSNSRSLIRRLTSRSGGCRWTQTRSACNAQARGPRLHRQVWLW